MIQNEETMKQQQRKLEQISKDAEMIQNHMCVIREQINQLLAPNRTEPLTELYDKCLDIAVKELCKYTTKDKLLRYQEAKLQQSLYAELVMKTMRRLRMKSSSYIEDALMQQNIPATTVYVPHETGLIVPLTTVLAFQNVSFANDSDDNDCGGVYFKHTRYSKSLYWMLVNANAYRVYQSAAVGCDAGAQLGSMHAPAFRSEPIVVQIDNVADLHSMLMELIEHDASRELTDQLTSAAVDGYFALSPSDIMLCISVNSIIENALLGHASSRRILSPSFNFKQFEVDRIRYREVPVLTKLQLAQRAMQSFLCMKSEDDRERKEFLEKHGPMIASALQAALNANAKRRQPDEVFDAVLKYSDVDSLWNNTFFDWNYSCCPGHEAVVMFGYYTSTGGTADDPAKDARTELIYFLDKVNGKWVLSPRYDGKVQYDLPEAKRNL